jgi:ADP-ribose pyrophosphatase YjhB (NUDIX family)
MSDAREDIPRTRAAFGYLRDPESGRLLMVANQYDGRGICWGLPGGAMEEGESPETCLAREFGEEVGLVVRIVRPLGAIERRKPEWSLNLYAHFFEVESSGGEPRIDPDDDHVVAFRFLLPEEIGALPGTVLGRKWILDYLRAPETYPKDIVMDPDEE